MLWRQQTLVRKCEVRIKSNSEVFSIIAGRYQSAQKVSTKLSPFSTFRGCSNQKKLRLVWIVSLCITCVHMMRYALETLNKSIFGCILCTS